MEIHCGNTPGHGKSLEGNKEDTWPVELGQLPAEGTASGSSPALSAWQAQLLQMGQASSIPAKTQGAPAPTAPYAHGFARQKGEKVAFLWGLVGTFSFFSPRRKEGNTWHGGWSEEELGDSGDVAVGGERSLYEALITPAKIHISPMSERRFLRG